MLRNKAKRKTSKRAHWSFLLTMIDHFRKKKKKHKQTKKKSEKIKNQTFNVTADTNLPQSSCSLSSQMGTRHLCCMTDGSLV